MGLCVLSVIPVQMVQVCDRVKGHYDLATAIIHTGKEFQTSDRVKVHTIVALRTMLLSIRVRNSELGYRVTMTQLP